jgi:hypothetical protein
MQIKDSPKDSTNGDGLTLGAKLLMLDIALNSVGSQDTRSITELARDNKSSNSKIAGFLTELEAEGLIEIRFY